MNKIIRIPKLLQLTGLVSSMREARRKLDENAVKINGIKINCLTTTLEFLGDSPNICIGKKSVRVKWIDTD